MNTSKPEILEQRIRYESVPYTFWQRVGLWAGEVFWAIRTPPPATWSKPVVLNPGDPGYDSPFNAILVRQRSDGTWPPTTLRRGFTTPLEPADLERLGQAEALTAAEMLGGKIAWLLERPGAGGYYLRAEPLVRGKLGEQFELGTFDSGSARQFPTRDAAEDYIKANPVPAWTPVEHLFFR